MEKNLWLWLEELGDLAYSVVDRAWRSPLWHGDGLNPSVHVPVVDESRSRKLRDIQKAENFKNDLSNAYCFLNFRIIHPRRRFSGSLGCCICRKECL